jgi:hypothetical protein
METEAAIDKRALPLPLFVTLTYPGDWQRWNAEDWKRHRDNFAKALLRAHPGAFALWKLEFQARGAPHYHLVVYGVRFLDHDWVASAWYRIVGSGDPRHLAAGTEVRQVRSWRGTRAYVSKYLAKVGPVPEGYTGRFWGVIGRKNMPTEVIRIILDDPQFYRLKRIIRKWLAKRGYNVWSQWHQGLTAFLGWAVALKLVESLE